MGILKGDRDGGTGTHTRHRAGCFTGTHARHRAGGQGFQIIYVRRSQISLQHLLHGLHTVLTRALHIPGKLSPDVNVQVVPAAEQRQLLFQHRVKFFYCHDLLKAVHELKHQLFRRGVGCGYLDDTRALISVQRFHDKLITDPMGNDSLDCLLFFPVHKVKAVGAEILPDYRVARLNHLVVCIGQTRKNNPFIRILHESLGRRETDPLL